MNFRELTPQEIESLPEDFYLETDRLKSGAKYRPDVLGRFIGAFDGEALVGVWVVMPVIHCGPFWVAADRRGNSTAIRAGMWEGVKTAVKGFGASQALMVAMKDSPAAGRVIRKLPSTEVPGQLFTVEIN